ncbi:MAG TPA: ROK family protein [Methylomirabilota bacterium]|nr:ROK family protein [Methylomirabilota bacterium]
MDHPIRIGVDLGGTKTEVIALAADGREIYRKRTATPSGDYAAQIDLVARLVAELEQAVSAMGTVGVGIPGAISPATGLIKNANSNWLIGKPLDRDLAAALGRPVRLQNDANCLAVSEATDGAAAGCDVVFAAILGTGVGGGIVVRGWPLTGRNAIAGEWGHTQLAWREASERPGPACYCGLHGCLETLLSGPGLAADYRAATGRDLRGEAIATRAAEGDVEAEAALQRYDSRLARGLATVINVLDPDVIVLGGGLSNLDRLYRNVPAIWDRWVFSDRVDTPLRKAAHGDSSGVRGAAWLWPPTA